MIQYASPPTLFDFPAMRDEQTHNVVMTSAPSLPTAALSVDYTSNYSFSDM